MNTLKPTAVDWLREKIQSNLSEPMSPKFAELFEEAREMDIQQKEYMFNCGRQFQLTGECTFKQVMHETYGKSE